MRAPLQPIAAVLLFLMPLASALGSVITIGGLAVSRPLAGVLLLVALTMLGRWGIAASISVALGTVWLVPGLLGMGENDAIRPLLSVVLGIATLVSFLLVARQPRDVRVLVWGWAFAWVIAVLPGLREILTGQRMPNYLESSSPYIRLASKDAASFFVNPNLFALFLGASMLVLLMGAELERGRRRWVLVVMALANPFLIHFTGSRIIQAVTLLVAAWYVLRALRSDLARRRILAIGGAVVVLGVAVFAVLPGSQAALATYLKGSGFTRINLYLNGLWMFGSTGGVGVGPGGFERVILSGEAPLETGGANNPHSGVVELMSDYGSVVSACMAALFIALFIKMAPSFWRRFAVGRHAVWGQALAMAAFTFPVVSFANSVFFDSPIVWLYAASLLVFVQRFLDERATMLPAVVRAPLPALPLRMRSLRRLRRAEARGVSPAGR
ncbi:hypothetical protein BW730_16075 [Tessaracoccus aquimaris]|uniref:O-antigen polymerase n=1 Tax=Tessaracoccus aquimaris TaxID=1332264 RepID=A0A1Q2CRQ2_9ACTN|nr:hypothetical protein [Tessaracoccus aquimaris]AQP48796.1 hypothetical protein BW730_16075 [Tessaracoccus aquimaris]